MKKIVCLMIALMVCFSIAAPAYATESTFVPSITEKDGPQLVLGKDENDEDTYGRILDANGNVIGYLYKDCIVITPISKAEKSDLIPENASETLIAVYDQLVDGSMQIPYEKISADLNSDMMVIRELIDISLLCEDHPEILAPKGVTIELTFDMGVSNTTDVYIMSYKNNEWNPIVKTTNNGNGTVTAVFEDFCPVSFSIRKGAEEPTPPTGDNTNLTVWIVLLVVSFVGLAAVIIFRRKIVRKNEN